MPWRVSAPLGYKAAEGLTKLGRNDETLAMLKQLEAQFPKAIRPKQLRALARLLVRPHSVRTLATFVWPGQAR